MPFAELVDLDKEIGRLKKEEERLSKELARVDGMLNNEKFVSRAPKDKIDQEKEKQAKYRQMMEQVKERLAQLGQSAGAFRTYGKKTGICDGRDRLGMIPAVFLMSKGLLQDVSLCGYSSKKKGCILVYIYYNII